MARNGLIECGTQLPSTEQAGIEAGLQAVEQALATEDVQLGSGDLDQLKAALSTLDQATQGLAELLMDRVLEAALRKRGTIG